MDLEFRVYQPDEQVPTDEAPITFRDAFQTFGAILQNLHFTHDKNDSGIVPEIKQNDRIVLFLHGLGQTGRAFTPAVREFGNAGYTGVAPTYNPHELPSKVINQVVLPLITRIEQNGARINGIVGHSTEADHLRFGLLYNSALQSIVDRDSISVILSAEN